MVCSARLSTERAHRTLEPTGGLSPMKLVSDCAGIVSDPSPNDFDF